MVVFNFPVINVATKQENSVQNIIYFSPKLEPELPTGSGQNAPAPLDYLYLSRGSTPTVGSSRMSSSGSGSRDTVML